MNFNDLKTALSPYYPSDIVFLALGNTFRGDDGVGIIFTQYLQNTQEFSCANFIFAYTTPENYLQQIIEIKPKLIVCIDSARMGSGPGDIQWLSPSMLDSFRISTHAFSILMIETYLKNFTQSHFFYIGIEPQQTLPDQGLSHIVENQLALFFKTVLV